MTRHNFDTASIFKWVLRAHSRLAWYARSCKKRGLTYRAFVEELEGLRRDVLKTPDGVLMNPESNDALDMVSITAAWNRLRDDKLDGLFLEKDKPRLATTRH